MQKTIVGKLARLDRAKNTKNGGPVFNGYIVTVDGQLIPFRTMPDSTFSYAVSAYVGVFGRWTIKQWRGLDRLTGVDFAAPADTRALPHCVIV